MRFAAKATKGKGKRWTKGGSSSSNPDNKKHRLLAKNINPSSAGPSRSHSQHSLRLTEDALNQHNLTQLQRLSLSKTSLTGADDAESVGGQSFATVWTNCSNVSFNKLLLRFDASSAVHKQMLAVLAAVTETINSNGGKETETEYFAALMTALDSVDSEETLTAILSLIQMVIKRLPSTVIRVKFSETSKVLVEYLAKYVKGDNGLIVRSLITSISGLLLQQESAVWELSQTKHIFEIILSLAIHTKPRIRKCAQKSIARILRSNPNQSVNALCHPMAKLTADFCIRKIEENSTNDNINSTLYVFMLLSDVLSVLPNSSLKKSAEAMLTQMTFGNVLIVSTAFKAFYLLFSAQPNEDILTPELNAKLISALYDYQPNINDSQPLVAWLQTIQKAFSNLYRINKKLCFNHLPKLFNTVIPCLLSDAKEVHTCVANSLKQIYTDCIQPSTSEIESLITEKIFSCLEKSLQFEYCNAWTSLIGLISHMFDENHSQLTTGIIAQLIVIRESYDCVYASEIDVAIGRAVQVFGPKYVLDLCPLQLNEERNDLSHNWLLPVLKDNVRNTELSIFAEYFVPISHYLERTCNQLESDGNRVTAKTCSILIDQIWSLLPSFCTNPKDFDKSFRRLAQTLGSILSNKPSFRTYVLNAFRQLSKSFENPLIAQELSKFSKNFVPILFNIYTNEQDFKNIGQNVFEVIQIFLSITDKSLIQTFYGKLLEKLKTESNSFTRQTLMDLIRAFVGYVNEQDIKNIYNQIVLPFVQNNEHKTEQKKAFRILEEICKNDAVVCQQFFSDSSNEILKLLIESIDRCLSSSKAFVLKALKEIIDKCLDKASIDWKNLLPVIVVKSLNCLSINSRKVKTSALDLLLSITNAYKALDGNPDFMFETLIKFLIDKQYSSTSVITSLTHLYSQFRNQLPKHVECDLIENIISSIGSDNRQTIQSSIDFLKYFFRDASPDQLSTYLELIISKLSSIDGKHRKHFRMKVKQMFIRLVRKYGFPMISKMIPEEYRKVLKNIRKVEDKKRKMNDNDNEDSDRQTTTTKTHRRHEFDDIIADSSEEESDADEQMTTVSQKNNKSWIKEGSDENEIIDLLSSDMSKNILHKNPETSSKTKSETFETTSDGRLVIQDLDNPSKGLKRKRDEEEADNEEVDSEPEEDMRSMKQSVKSSKSGYRTGGKGIHREVRREPGEEYRSTKAEGDMKRKGRPDPFAYIPLNRQYLNKRKKARIGGHFNNLIKAAKKGAHKGSATNARKKRRN